MFCYQLSDTELLILGWTYEDRDEREPCFWTLDVDSYAGLVEYSIDTESDPYFEDLFVAADGDVLIRDHDSVLALGF